MLLGWQRWIHEQCTEHGRVLGGEGAPLTCMQCDATLAYEDVRRLTRCDGALMAMVERRTVEGALAAMDGFKWCPRCSSGGWWPPTAPARVHLGAATCVSAADAAGAATVRISLTVAAPAPCTTRECVDCSYRWCSECERPESEHKRSDEWLPCNRVEEVLLHEWQEKNRHTVKKCCKCGVLTEHVAGCSHMRCRCGQEWCWLCERPYQGKYVFLNGRPDQKCPCPPRKGGESSTSR